MTNCQQQRPDLIYTPTCHIPVGEAVKTETGHQALKLKYKDRTEVITLDSLFSMVYQANEKKK